MPYVVLPLLLLLLAGCATAYSGAVNAYREGRYAEAASRFEELLSRDPDHLDALVGLGVSRYRLGAYDDAIRTLERAAAREPKHPAPRLYLALAHLQKNDIGAAEAQLLAFRERNP